MNSFLTFVIREGLRLLAPILEQLDPVISEVVLHIGPCGTEFSFLLTYCDLTELLPSYLNNRYIFMFVYLVGISIYEAQRRSVNNTNGISDGLTQEPLVTDLYNGVEETHTMITTAEGSAFLDALGTMLGNYEYVNHDIYFDPDVYLDDVINALLN
jgi:hypothetical protein